MFLQENTINDFGLMEEFKDIEALAEELKDSPHYDDLIFYTLNLEWNLELEKAEKELIMTEHKIIVNESEETITEAEQGYIATFVEWVKKLARKVVAFFKNIYGKLVLQFNDTAKKFKANKKVIEANSKLEFMGNTKVHTDYEFIALLKEITKKRGAIPVDYSIDTAEFKKEVENLMVDVNAAMDSTGSTTLKVAYDAVKGNLAKGNKDLRKEIESVYKMHVKGINAAEKAPSAEKDDDARKNVVANLKVAIGASSAIFGKCIGVARRIAASRNGIMNSVISAKKSDGDKETEKKAKEAADKKKKEEAGK